MRAILGGLYLAALISFAAPVALAQTQSLDAAADRADALLEAGDHAAAEAASRLALQQAERELGPDDELTVYILNGLALALDAQGRREEALPLFAEVLARDERRLGHDHPELATDLANLAGLQFGLQRFDAAEANYARALGILEAAEGLEAPALVEFLRPLAQLAGSDSRFDEAEAHYRRALAILDRQADADLEALVEILNLMASLYAFQGRHDAAAPLLERALALRQAASGPDSALTAHALGNLGDVRRQQGRFEDAEALFKRQAEATDNAFGEASPEAAAVRHRLADLYRDLGRHDEAEALYRQALAGMQAALGAEHADTAVPLQRLGGLYLLQGRHDEAEAALTRALALREASGDAEAVAATLGMLARVLTAEGRFEAAEPLLRRQLETYEATQGADGPDVAAALRGLAGLYQDRGHPAEALPLLQRALGIAERTLGPAHPAVEETVNLLATAEIALGRYGEAETHLERVLALTEARAGPDHLDLAAPLNNLAGLHARQARHEAAERLYRRALAIREKRLGPRHRQVALLLANLADLQQKRGRWSEAEALETRALSIYEETLGPEHVEVAYSLNNLGGLYVLQRRYDEAEPLLRRALALMQANLGPEHPQIGQPLGNLALVYAGTGRAAEAVLLLERALAIAEKAFGPDHVDVANAAANLASTVSELGRQDEAERLYLGALEIFHRAFGPEHPNVALMLGNLAVVYERQGRPDDVARLFRQAIAINRKVLGDAHPAVSDAYENLADFYRRQDRIGEALGMQRAASAIRSQQYIRTLRVGAVGADRERQANRAHFLRHVDLALDARNGLDARTRVGEAFKVAQAAAFSSASESIKRMAARFGSGSDALAEFVRRQQDTLDRLQLLERLLVEAASRPAEQREPAREAEMRAEIEVLRQRQEALRAEIAERFPKYAELTRPPPLTLDQARALLGPGEALLVFSRAADPDKTHAWVFRHDRDLAYTAEIGLETIADDVADLRDGVDLANATSLSDLPRFDTRLAYDLYQRLMAPAEPLLEGVRHLYLVPDGALGGIPPGILVTAPQTLPPQTPAQYREVPWLARRFATTVLPSVTALRVLRRFSAQARAARPFVGFGDPLLEGPAGGGRGTIDFAALTRGGDGLADPEAVRRLPRLPDTAEELVAVAAALGSAPAAVHTGAAATERAVRRADLSDVRIISFATHGLVAGELSGLPEPALVLTPPERRSAEDDGLLMASEIARLKLNADWVVLSACNTAAGAGPDAEGLSGLANAFFYAGTRALLVSHWSVSSAATVRLMTGMFQAMADDPTLGRAEALRRVTLEMQSDPAHPEFAHPAFWAPFVVVGAGGAPAAR